MRITIDRCRVAIGCMAVAAAASLAAQQPSTPAATGPVFRSGLNLVLVDVVVAVAVLVRVSVGVGLFVGVVVGVGEALRVGVLLGSTVPTLGVFVGVALGFGVAEGVPSGVAGVSNENPAPLRSVPVCPSTASNARSPSISSNFQFATNPADVSASSVR